MVTEGFLPNGHGHPGVLPNGRPNGHGHPENFPNGQWSQPLGIDHMEKLDVGASEIPSTSLQPFLGQK